MVTAIIRHPWKTKFQGKLTFLGMNSNVEIVDDQAQRRLSHLVLAVMKFECLVMLAAMVMSDMYRVFFFLG